MRDYPLPYQHYQEGLARGVFQGLKCGRCGSITFPPMAVCRDCSDADLEPVLLSGRGWVRTFTVVRVPPEGRTFPYVVAMVELEEGPWVMGNLIDLDPDQASMDLMGKEVRMGAQRVKVAGAASENVHAISFLLVR
jgi:uncharacterized OB-fold protein